MKIGLSTKFSVGEQIRLSRRLSALLGAGIGIVEACSFIERSIRTKNTKKKLIVSHIIEHITHGGLCSEAFGASRAFDEALVHMVAIGEKSGSLKTAFTHAATLLEKREALSRKLYGALIYPGFIACATTGIAGFLVVYIFPKIIPLVTGMNIPLPLLTRILIVVSRTLIYHWVFLLLLFGLASIALYVAWKYSRLFRRTFRAITMRLPVFGGLMHGHVIVQIFRPLGLLLTHGEHIPNALVSISGAIRNEEYAKELHVIAGHVTNGGSFSGYISRANSLFPALVVDFIETGERTGGIAGACGHIADLYESDLDESVKHLSVIIEPALMLCMGVVVGGIALSIVLPIYEITSHLSQ
jgi:type IV pilus assembly protein PilC